MYLLDANIFIQSHRQHYGLDFAPGFWDWIDAHHSSHTLTSVDKVGIELARGKDELTTWAAARKSLWSVVGSESAPALAKLASWSKSGHFTEAAVAEFLDSADYYLVAFAATHGHTVVTMELSEPNRKSKVKIPEACKAVGVSWISLAAALRATQAKLILDA